MKRRGWLLLGCTALLSTALLQPVLAHDRDYDHCDHGRPMMGGPGFPGGYPDGRAYGYGYGYGYRDHHSMRDGDHGMQRLDLSDEQQDAIHKIMRAARSDFRQLEEKIRDKQDDLYDLIDEGKDTKKIDGLADEIGDLMAARIKLRADVRMKVLKELTPKQRDEAGDIPFLGWGFGGYRY